jgi:hypothetical protein
MVSGMPPRFYSLIVMAYEPKSYVRYAGRKSILNMGDCMLIGLRAELRVFIRCMDLS